MTLNGVMALILRYFVEFVVVKPLCMRPTVPRFQNLLFNSLWP